jgi:hypothetical protein
MKGPTIHKKITSTASRRNSGLTDTLIGCLIFVAILVALPFLLFGLLISFIRDKLAPKDQATHDEAVPIIMHDVPNGYFTLRYQYIMGEEISVGACDYFGDDEPLILYRTEPKISFFEGYFSNFKIERIDGIFIQKVNFNTDLSRIETMPLYFFNYATKEAEEIHDLKDYALDIKGGSNRFIIMANGLEDDIQDLEIEITVSS